MRTGLIVLPFLAVLVLAISQAVASAFVNLSWVSYLGYGLAAACLASWVYFDRLKFKRFFSRKGFRYGASSGVFVLMIFTALVLIAHVTNRDTFNVNWDVTKNKVSTLDEASVEVVEKYTSAEKSVNVTGIFQQPDMQTKFDNLLKLYIAAGLTVEKEMIDIASNPQRIQALKVTSENTAIFKVGSRDARITTFAEEDITNALLNLLKDGSKRIYFTKGHNEPSLTATDANGFANVKQLLDIQKIESSELSLFEEGSVPEDADLVVVAGGQYDFQQGEVDLLENYLKQGGSVLLAVESATDLPLLNAFTQRYGLKIENDYLIIDNRDPRSRMFPGYASVSDFDSMHSITKSFSAKGGARGGVEMFVNFARSISLTDSDNSNTNKEYNAQLIAKTSPLVMRITDIKDRKDLETVKPDRISRDGGPYGFVGVSTLTVTAKADTEDEDKDKKTTDSSSTPTTGNLVVLGSAKVLSNQSLVQPVNRDFFGDLVAFLVRDENFVTIPNKEFSSGSIDMTSPKSQLAYNFMLYIYPFLFLGVSLLYWLVRKRKTA
ncbi:MAG: Gldg family protein [Proteobacteria bacterium]|nr:Gldg family protein [Pseudomonadota bacterium]